MGSIFGKDCFCRENQNRNDEEKPAVDKRVEPKYAETHLKPTESEQIANESTDLWPAEECAVCFELMGGDCPMRRLSCGHGYHPACIAQWLKRNASCPLCKAVTPEVGVGMTEGHFNFSLGHQEMAQFLTELESIFQAIHACAGPDRPIAIHGLAYNLCTSLGYEDEDELEEALGGTLADFLSALPHFEVTWTTEEREDGEESEAVARAVMLPEPTEEEMRVRPGTRIMFTVSESKDLWRVVLQGPKAVLKIPEIEFEIQPYSNRRIDTIYNILAAAIFHLGDHVQKNKRAGSITEVETTKIVECIDNLNRLLDIEEPFTFIISDPQGVSELKPLTGAHVGAYEGN